MASLVAPTPPQLPIKVTTVTFRRLGATDLFNVKTAKVFGLTIPQSILARADELIE